MSTVRPERLTGSDSPPSGRGSKGRKKKIALGIAALVVLALVALLWSGLTSAYRPDPKFPSLADKPDSSLQGTVAYYADTSGCVRIVAAAGQPSRDVLCPAGPNQSKAESKGKEIGPGLAWLPDGRLEVTMFRFADEKGEQLQGSWQKIIDLRTGKTQDVPAAEVPAAPAPAVRPMASPGGEQITVTSEEGHVQVTLRDNAGTRTLLSAEGGIDYRLGAFWAPNWQWIVADDNRILIITTGDPSVTRVLTADSQGSDDRLARFAVTDANLLTSSK